ncbi:unnamed protein product [Clonostachys rosea]|uniref:NmrA-like domain-containing protein n=1 Tax=Bionectria ochroleuca TaxID=29856 RepID=A0ABY6UXW7_BIOOC|nr:unnamed protein product [Clonostachys rosea]
MLGKTALISGSSAGIGAAIALELSARGANIVLNYPFPALESECNAVGAKLKTPWIAVCADLATIDGPTKLVEAAVARFGVIDILVNNAAVVPHIATWNVTPELWDSTHNLNARGAFLLTQAVLPHLPPYTPSSPASPSGVKSGSRIICIGSGSSRIPQPELIIYSSTKGAMESMIKVWAKELPPKYGCTVNGIAPGPVNTETFQRGAGDQLEAIKAEFEKEIPCEGSLAEPEDVAWAVAFLADDRSKWINGEYIMSAIPREYASHLPTPVEIDYSSIDAISEILLKLEVDTVISALNLHWSGASDSQINLIRGAAASGVVTRFIPSEFNVDYHCPEERLPYGPRAEFLRAEAELSAHPQLTYSLVRCGFFMDYLGLPYASTNLHPLYCLVDLAAGKAVLPGEGNDRVVFTHTRDVGKFVAMLLGLEASKWPKEASISGQRITTNELVDLFDKVTGKLL